MQAEALQSAGPSTPPLKRLPNRRPHQIMRIDVDVAGVPEPMPIHLQATWCETAGGPQIVECFARGGGKGNGPRDEELSEIAIMISLLLRIGYTPTGIRRRLSAPDHDGRPSSIVSAIVDALAKAQDDMVAEWHNALV